MFFNLSSMCFSSFHLALTLLVSGQLRWVGGLLNVFTIQLLGLRNSIDAINASI